LLKKAFNLSLYILAPLLSGALVALAFPNYNLAALAWVGLVPLLVAISGRRLRSDIFQSYFCGLVFFAVNLIWLFEIARYTVLQHCFLVAYLALFFALFGGVFSLISRRFGAAPAYIAAPFIWVSLEFLRSNLGFMACPIASLSHSQYQVSNIIQISSITGSYGVTFLIIQVNSALAAVMRTLFGHLKNSSPTTWSAISGRSAACIAGASVQGNIEQAKKWDPRHAKYIMQSYADLTMQVAGKNPTLIIWPEAATPRSLSVDKRVYARVRAIQKKAGPHILLGSSSHEKFRVGQKLKVQLHNSAFLIGPQSQKKVQRYDKIRLLPFGEYLPYKDRLPWSWINIPNLANYVRGKEYTVFEFNDLRFGVNICWEIGFPELNRQFVKNGAQFMVNLTNMAWFGKSAAPYQMLTASVFRAVENRVFMVRCSNTGISCFIDPYGRIVSRVKNEKGEDIFVRGVLTDTVVLQDSKTIYTQYGEWFVWLSTTVSVALFLAAILNGIFVRLRND
jgi:apolipoprotein N-acyltransferase